MVQAWHDSVTVAEAVGEKKGEVGVNTAKVFCRPNVIVPGRISL